MLQMASNNAELPEQLLDALHPELNVNIFLNMELLQFVVLWPILN